MKVAVSATGGSLDSQVDPRFGRCAYFIVVDTDTMNFEAIKNTGAFEASGAGIQAAQTIVSKGVKAVVTGNVGPNAYQVLSSAGVRIFTGAYGTVKEAVERLLRGELSESSSPRFGGPGMGRGYGIGFGRGRGFTANPSTHTHPPPFQPPFNPSKDEEIQALEEQMKVLQRKLEEIRQKIERLKSGNVGGGENVG
ncbi:MAG: NifB/NifX family molybdenum-iron cluster-binding protein [Nitrososphaeria archaeon]